MLSKEVDEALFTFVKTLDDLAVKHKQYVFIFLFFWSGMPQLLTCNTAQDSMSMPLLGLGTSRGLPSIGQQHMEPSAVRSLRKRMRVSFTSQAV
jgi:hypothetical protein